jgi:signal peptidase I
MQNLTDIEDAPLASAQLANDSARDKGAGTNSAQPAAHAAPGARQAKASWRDQPGKKEGESWIETVKTIVYALLIALVIRTFFFQPFNIPSGSMENTLLVGDYLFVAKFADGYSRFSFPFGQYLPSFGRIFGTGPRRGDVVVFKMPNPNSSDYMKDFIKRVIGVPGDRIQMVNGQVILDGKPVPKLRAADYVTNDPPCPMANDVPAFGPVHVPRYRESLPGGKSYYVLDCLPDGPSDNTPVYIVPPGHYFMMGDNRDNSDDSRAEVGFVPAENVEGKAEILFFSIDSSTEWWEFWKWPWAIRYNRLLTVID